MDELIEIDEAVRSRHQPYRHKHSLVGAGPYADKAYSAAPGELIPHRAGAHFRDLLEFYRGFINGVEWLQTGYDARQRDRAIEQNRAAASAAIRKLIRFLETSDSLRKESTIWVRMEDADARDLGNSFMESSISRELQVLSSHTIHHFAMIAMALRLHGIEVDPEFGIAPSTLRYLAAKPTMPSEAA